ncbi:MAG TPA: di-heme oxidoredictase family protein, partial [Steroidobacteraceae bacterium]|nr:di-heme oxidoredictase family protein [Steroidobacteraceae bacterium]
LLAISCAPLPRDVKTDPAVEPEKTRADFDSRVNEHSRKLLEEGRETYRYDSFGSEDFWGGKLRLHEAILGEKQGGVGAGLTPRQALQAGLKVDVGKVPRLLVEVMREGAVSLDNPETTLELLRADAVVGVKGVFGEGRKMTAIGITCALCHSTVDNSFAKGIGSRLDGWPNRDLNVGAIVAMAPTLKPFADLLGTDEAGVRKVLLGWGPGRYDAELNLDGRGVRPDGKTAATLLPAAFGLPGVNLHTYTGWGSVTYWNAYVANTQMHGKGVFFDPRMKNPTQYPVAARAGLWNIRNSPDLVTPKLAALHYYQLSIPAPEPPEDSYDKAAARRGKALFETKAQCATCHVPPLFTEPGWSMHTAEEIGIDDFQASRSPDQKFYRTTPLGGLFTRQQGGFYHDGRFANLEAVVAHYSRHLNLGLSNAEQGDLVQYLKSL